MKVIMSPTKANNFEVVPGDAFATTTSNTSGFSARANHPSFCVVVFGKHDWDKINPKTGRVKSRWKCNRCGTVRRKRVNK